MNKTLLIATLTVWSLLFGACREEYPADCAGYSAQIYMRGCAYAEGSYEDFGDYAIFVRNRVADTLNGRWKHDDRERSIQMYTINDVCAERMKIGVKNISLSKRDTIKLLYSELGLARDFPTADLDYLDADAIFEQYDLVEGSDSWLLLEEVNADSTLLRGRFQASFVTTFEPYLNGELERWDDPNRPDTLHFRNGRFEAEFVCF